jgi:hypothetical protein
MGGFEALDKLRGGLLELAVFHECIFEGDELGEEVADDLFSGLFDLSAWDWGYCLGVVSRDWFFLMSSSSYICDVTSHWLRPVFILA